MHEFIVNVLASTLAGVIFTLLLFIFNEFIFPKKTISGEWNFEEHIQQSSVNNLVGYVLKFKFHLLQKGYEIEGTGEKISELNTKTNESYSFEPEKRVKVTISGYLERKFWKRDQLYLTLVEEGRKRESRTVFKLVFESKKKLTGKFVSTAANSNGAVIATTE